MNAPEDDLFPVSIDTTMLSADQWRLHVDRRLDKQDRVLRRILLILIVGKGGWIAMRWLLVLAVSLIPAWVAWKSK